MNKETIDVLRRVSQEEESDNQQEAKAPRMMGVFGMLALISGIAILALAKGDLVFIGMTATICGAIFVAADHIHG